MKLSKFSPKPESKLKSTKQYDSPEETDELLNFIKNKFARKYGLVRNNQTSSKLSIATNLTNVHAHRVFQVSQKLHIIIKMAIWCEWTVTPTVTIVTIK